MCELIDAVKKAIDLGMLDEIPGGLTKEITSTQPMRIGSVFTTSQRTITVPDTDAIRTFVEAQERRLNRFHHLEIA